LKAAEREYLVTPGMRKGFFVGTRGIVKEKKKKRTQNQPKKRMERRKSRTKKRPKRRMLDPKKIPRKRTRRKIPMLQRKKKKKASESRIADQKAIDALLIPHLKKVPLLKKYLRSKFSLKKGQHPHLLKF